MTLRLLSQTLLSIAVATVFAARLAASAQTFAEPSLPPDTKPLAYDVVSVKVNKSGIYNMGYYILPDGFEATNVTLQSLMQTAYSIDAYLMSGDPAWLSSTKFDIKAKLASRSDEEIKQLRGQFQPLLQGSLEDRFQLKVHKETKQLPVYDLVLAKGGPKFKEETLEERDGQDKKPNGLARGSSNWNNGVYTQRLDSMRSLARTLSSNLHRTVIDKTGLTGDYDFTLKWADENRQQKDDGSAESSVPNVFTALQEQLGLKLQPSKGPVETLVIDHVEQPSEN